MYNKKKEYLGYAFCLSAELQAYLNKTYAPANVSFKLSKEANFSYGGNLKLLENKSGLLDAYTEDMKAFNSKYVSHVGKLKENTLYLFFANYGFGGEKFAAGFMPRQQQLGYIFIAEASQDLYRVVAHELGHGAANLAHTFDKTKYGIAQGSTQNLMDYSDGTELVKLQWDALHDQGEVWRMFESDEEGMYANPNFFYDYMWGEINSELSKVAAFLKDKWSYLKNTFNSKQPEGAVENNPEKIQEILLGIKAAEKEYQLNLFTVNYGASIKLNNETYKISLYCKADSASKIDISSYTEEKFENGYTLLNFKAVSDSRKTILVVQVNSDKLDAFKEFLFGKELRYSVGSIKTAASDATKDADDLVPGAACNICVRAAIWRIAESSVLFPNTDWGAWLGAPDKSHRLFGKADGTNETAGQANSIYLSLENGKMRAEFEPIPNMPNTTIPDFTEIQKMANRGIVIIGVMPSSSGSGHIVMVTPHSNDLSVGNYNYRDILKNEVPLLMPKVLECGYSSKTNTKRREPAECLQSGLTEEDIKKTKWYKMVGVYKSPKNILYNP